MPPLFNAIYYPKNPLAENQYDNIKEQATAYPFAFSTDRNGEPKEGAAVWFAWNEKGLYVGAELEDSYVMAQSREDETLHFETGDLLECFVKPTHADYYWEMYATPFANKTTLFFPAQRAGMTLDQFLHDHPYHQLDVAATQTPTGWRAEMWIPAKQLTALGAPWNNSEDWSIFCGRYNYNNENLKDPELSMVPPLSATNYHLTNEYAALKLLPQPE